MIDNCEIAHFANRKENPNQRTYAGFTILAQNGDMNMSELKTRIQKLEGCPAMQAYKAIAELLRTNTAKFKGKVISVF